MDSGRGFRALCAIVLWGEPPRAEVSANSGNVLNGVCREEEVTYGKRTEAAYAASAKPTESLPWAFVGESGARCEPISWLDGLTVPWYDEL